MRAGLCAGDATGLALNGLPVGSRVLCIEIYARSPSATGQRTSARDSAETDSREGNGAAKTDLTYSATNYISRTGPALGTLIVCITQVAYIATHGASSSPSAWYAQVLVTPALILSVLGAKRWRRAGLVLALALPLLFGYVLALTYVFKLIPLYGGYEGVGSIRNIAMLYGTQFQALSSNLGFVALGSAPVIFGLTLVLLVLIFALEVRMIGGLLRTRPPS